MPSAELSARYAKYLWKRNVAGEHHEEYQKCLLRFLESSAEAPQCHRDAELMRHFMKELASDNQPLPQRQHAANAVSLYLQMLKEEGSCLRDGGTDPPTGSMTRREGDAHPQSQPAMFRRFSRYSEAGYTLKSDSPEWDRLIDTLAAEVKVRHYSRSTLKTYAHWSRQFQRFLQNKPPNELCTDDVKKYLTFLAVKCRVAASTQNQAFNSLLFLYRHCLKGEFGELRDVPRAKKSLYIPMVLSRQEIDAILSQLAHPYALAVKLLFGCGLRLFECLQLRVGDFNFEAGIHSGTPLPLIYYRQITTSAPFKPFSVTQA